ncbi:MarR family winged helix-turn-helix transcriptional regulator [Georgenia sp. Z1344]|uniref:MarR family winged helix-turn-helix transcriptional regulator n=1 Tax=Georgenia sp. Z1344 TaxID=3416706 RepID=UPI003CF071EC
MNPQEADRPGTTGRLVGDLGMLAQVFQSRSREILAPLGTSLTHMTLLTHLERHPDGQGVAAIAAAIDIQQPGVSKAVARLAELGSVVVETDPADRRARRVRLSERGATELAGMRARLAGEVEAWFEDWDDARLAQLGEDVRRLAGRIDARRDDRRG